MSVQSGARAYILHDRFFAPAWVSRDLARDGPFHPVSPARPSPVRLSVGRRRQHRSRARATVPGPLA
jgi:hypothetical protein